jgi:hypothetical protein
MIPSRPSLARRTKGPRASARSLLILPAIALVACSNAPAARSPLREQLAASDNPAVEQATRACLTKTGWKVDPIAGLSGGADVVTAYKAKGQTDVYIYPPKTNPRITGGPDYSDAFWGCLGRELGGAPGAGAGDDKAAPADSSSGGADKGDKGDKGPKPDNK